MDVTPHELRDLDIADAFRGYNRDEVNDLLERAATTIETQAEKIRILTERVGTAVADVGVRRDNDDILQRTLIMAQRAADDAIASANAEAATIRATAEAQSAAMLDAAQRELHRINEEERGRIEREVLELSTRRDALVSDVRALESWDVDYRERLVRQIESDLNSARRRPPVEAIGVPMLTDVRTDDLSASRSMPTVAAEAAAVVPPAPVAPQPATSAHDDMATSQLATTPSSVALDAAEELLERPEPDYVPSAPAPLAVTVEPTPVTAEVPLATPVAVAGPDIDLRNAETDRSNLDDDAFFATLRDAVRDDAPLGPSEDAMYNSETDSGFREMFKRRR